ncbi:hypothetical protein [Kutzneria kofuensis]|uniref:hypothetical protein n=1 Tax=Kutzneria kofuensis TaxID=103725 RepID=UPI0031EEBECA
MVVAAALVLIVAAFAFGFWTSKNPGTPMPAANVWSYTVKTTNINETGDFGAAYKVSVGVPEFSGPDTQAIRVVNTMFRDRARKNIDDFATAADQTVPEDAGAGLELTEKATVQRIGLIAAVEFSGNWYGGGAHGLTVSDWTLIRTDTWQVIAKDQLFLPTARTAAGATRLAGVIAPRIKGSAGDPSCTTDAATLLAGGQSPTGPTTPTSFEDSMLVGMRVDSMQFDFAEYYLFSYGCGRAVATVPFSELDGLINPDVVRLATHQP